MNKQVHLIRFAMLAMIMACSCGAVAQWLPEDFRAHHRTPPPPAGQGMLDGLQMISPQDWDELQVRHVLNTFAWGGQASDFQIRNWANMPPQIAIRQMLTFEPVNLKLSAQGFKDPSTRYCHSLKELQNFWGSDAEDNPMRVVNRDWYATLDTERMRVSPLALHLTWSRLAHTPGCNAFLHKTALYFTNYHAAIHIQNAGPSLIRSYYDDTVKTLMSGGNFVELMTQAASHAALSLSYGHMGNHFDAEGVFNGNDDFAREYFQLLFGIQGTTEDEQYHEDVTIEHNAWLLTGMILDVQPYALGSEQRVDWLVAPLNFSNHRDAAGRLVPNQAIHFRDGGVNGSCLEILHQEICGANAGEKLQALGPVAAAHPESMANTPLKIIGFFGDEALDEAEQLALQTAWADADYQILTFLQSYAISTQFLQGDAYKQRSAFDRNLLIHNRNQLSAEEAYSEIFARGPTARMADQGALVFAPSHDVFGGQAGLDAANDRYVFKFAWDANVTDAQFLARTQEPYRLVEDGAVLSWEKDWLSIVPANAQGQRLVADVADWLWNRFIADGGKHLDAVARAQLHALLATGFDFGALVNRDQASVVYSSADLSTGVLAEYVQVLGDLPLSPLTDEASERIGMAINFISALPYTFANGGY